MRISELFTKCTQKKTPGFEFSTFGEDGNTYFVYSEKMRFVDFIFGRKGPAKKILRGVPMRVLGRIASSEGVPPVYFNNTLPITMVGFSYGAGRALIDYLNFKWNFPDQPVKAILFGCPRVFAFLKKRYRKLFADVSIYNDVNDPVASYPSKWLGYTEVGNIYTIGVKGKKSFKAHSIEQYNKSLGIVRD